jgi:anti-sigma regulatory factor (Ser/Thr protein kinase)
MRTAPDGLRVNNDLSELARIAAWVDAWARSQRLPDHVAERLHLCSEEAVTNIIMHAYADGASHPISLNLQRAGDTVALEIEDDGSAFDPRQRPAPQPLRGLENAHIGGWGIHIIRRFSDEMHYRRADARNRLTLVFRLSPAG